MPQKFLYQARPSKHIQRRMIVDVLRRLRVYGGLDKYQYIGFGAAELIDFELVRRELGVRDMISIECEPDIALRAEFNRPFDGIRIVQGVAREELPALIDRKRRRIVWLDYTSRLNREVIGDLKFCMRTLAPGSVVIVTYDSEAEVDGDRRMAQFRADVDPGRVPAGTSAVDLSQRRLADTQYTVLTRLLPDAENRRTDGSKIHQLFDFRYADGHRMSTWGAIVRGPRDASKLKRMELRDFAQYRTMGDPPLDITVPVLTLRETMHLNQQLPLGPADDLRADGIAEPELEQYARLHSWYPPVPTPI